MEGTYAVYLGSDSVGKVQLERQGLYYRIICRCQIPGNSVLRLYVESGGQRENLGVPVPDGEDFRLEKRIPVKRLKEGDPRFSLSSGMNAPEGKFVPICPEEPFAYIEELKNAFLASEHGKIGVRIKDNPGKA